MAEHHDDRYIGRIEIVSRLVGNQVVCGKEQGRTDVIGGRRIDYNSMRGFWRIHPRIYGMTAWLKSVRLSSSSRWYGRSDAGSQSGGANSDTRQEGSAGNLLVFIGHRVLDFR